MGSSPDRWKRPREQKGSTHARILSLCSHCSPAGAPLIFPIRPKGQVAEFPRPLGEAKGVWAEGKENSQATTRVLPCPVLKQASSCPFSMPQSPHLCNKEQELDQGVRNPNTKGVAAGTQRPPPPPNAATRPNGPGVATTLGFVEQSQKSGFLRAITSFFNVCKTSS